MKDRFDLEEEIVDTHMFTSQLKLLSDNVINGRLNNDQISSAINGIIIMLDLHANTLYDTMCQCFHLDSYHKE